MKKVYLIKSMTILVSIYMLFTLNGCLSSGKDNPSHSDIIVWAVGNADANGYASIFYSSDGGETWIRPNENATTLYGFDAQNLYVPKSDKIWVIGTEQTLIYSDTKGARWEKYNTLPDHNSTITLYSISGINSQDFWVSGNNGSVYHTTDGARSWKKFDTSIFYNGLVQGIKAIDAHTIYAVGKRSQTNTGFIVRTLDGGQNWESINLNNGGSQSEWIGVKATDTANIVVFGCKGNYTSTTNGGDDWISNHINSGGINNADINDLVMIDSHTWWNAMDLDNIYKTNDAGDNWLQQESVSPRNMYLIGIDAINKQHAIITGTSAGWPPAGKIIMTNDGGETWTLQLTTDYAINKISFIQDNETYPNEAEGHSMYASLISTALEGFIGGATGDVGGFVMGLILQELGWGNADNDNEDKLLQSMNNKLDDIVSDLSVIKNELNSLASQLQLDMDDIKKNILDPTDAINDIGTTHDEFISQFGDKKVGEENQTKIIQFIDEHIENNFHIEDAYNTISHAINPETIATTPALSNFTNYVNDSYGLKNGTLTDAYNTLELYTSQLLTHQLKAVNLIIEAKHIKDGNTSVNNFLKIYQSHLHQMIRDAGNGESFLYNAYRLALLHANPLPYKEGSSFLNKESEALLKRAFFYSLQATDSKTYGVRILVFETQDTDSNKDFFILNKDVSKGYSEFKCQQIDNPVPGHIYTHWDNNHIQSQTQYKVYECNISDPIKPGNYDIFDEDPSQLARTNIKSIAQIKIENYDMNYAIKKDANITYGLTTIFRRSEFNHFTHDSPYWHAHKSDITCSEIVGSPPWGAGIKGPYNCGTRQYKGTYEIRGDFHYDDSQERTLYIDYHAQFFALINKAYYGDEASASVHFGVWDITEDEEASKKCSPFYDFSHTGAVKHKFKKHIYPKGICSFTAKPNHSYHIYFKMHVKGLSDGYYDSYSKIYLDEIYHIHLLF